MTFIILINVTNNSKKTINISEFDKFHEDALI